MRRRLAFLGAGVALAAAVAVPMAATATPPTARSYPESPPPGQVEQRYGILRFDTSVHRWTILDTPLFQSSGLTGVACMPNGTLVVGFEPLTTIGTFAVDEDESYAGRYDAGASIVANAMTITIRKPSTGAVVSCAAAELQIVNSNLQAWVLGTRTAPTTQPTIQPTTQPTVPTAPTTRPPTTAPPTFAPPTIAPPSNVPTAPTSPTAPPSDPTSPPIIIG